MHQAPADRGQGRIRIVLYVLLSYDTKSPLFIVKVKLKRSKNRLRETRPIATRRASPAMWDHHYLPPNTGECARLVPGIV